MSITPEPFISANTEAHHSAPFSKPITDYRFFKQLCALPYVQAIHLYGSRARGDADAISDYDLAITCPNASAAEWEHIKALLDNAAFLNKVDYTRYDALEEGLYKSQIDKYKRLLYAQS